MVRPLLRNREVVSQSPATDMTVLKSVVIAPSTNARHLEVIMTGVSDLRNGGSCVATYVCTLKNFHCFGPERYT